MKVEEVKIIEPVVAPVSEEPKGNVLTQFINTIKDLWGNPTAKWVTLGGSFRFFEAFTAVYFLPSFYQKVYPLMKSEFGILNGLI